MNTSYVLTHLKSQLNDLESDPSRMILIRSGAARLFFKSGSVNISHNGQVLFGGWIISLSSFWMKNLIIVLAVWTLATIDKCSLEEELSSCPLFGWSISSWFLFLPIVLYLNSDQHQVFTKILPDLEYALNPDHSCRQICVTIIFLLRDLSIMSWMKSFE